MGPSGLRGWVDRAVKVQRTDGMFEPDIPEQEETQVEKSSDRRAA
jgi:hypothetical protein